MKTSTRTLTVLILALGLSASALADDTDIYLDPLVPAGAEPLVMFSLDWRPNLASSKCNFSTDVSECGYSSAINNAFTSADLSDNKIIFLELLRAVLRVVLDPISGVKIGFMINHKEGSCAGPQSTTKCSNGGYMVRGLKSLSEAGSKQELYDKLAAIPQPLGGTSHKYQGKELFFEFFRYLTGQGIYNGHNGWVDYGTDDSQNLPDDNPVISWDTSIQANNNKTYLNPFGGLVTGDCGPKIFTINMMFQVSELEDESDSAIEASKTDGGMGFTLSNLGAANEFGSMIKFLNDVDLGDGTWGTVPDLANKQNVISYFIVDPTKINQKTNGYANAGGTGTALGLSDDPDELVETLNNVFKSILSVSTTFVAPSVPVNVFNRAQALNEVFLALFEPDENGMPLWNGNLKKVAIGENAVTGDLELQDVNGDPAIDIDGRLRRDAVTFWTDPPSLPPPEDDEVAGADGRAVARGGAGQKIPNFASGNPECENDVGGRNLYTEDPGEAFADSDPGDDMLPLDCFFPNLDAIWTDLTANYDPPPPSRVLGSQDESDAIDDFCFLRGLQTDCLTPLPWMLADPLHSRPLPINYGARGSYTDTNPDIRILIGTNDGYMHMFENTNSSGAHTGTESWAFIPRAALKTTHRLQTNQAGDPKHPNTTDGSPVVLTKDANLDGTIDSGTAGDQALVFFGMRRGGTNLYAMDVTNPDDPKFLWRIFGGAGGTAGFEELTQTWSTPAVGKVRLNGVDTDVLVFGGGYNGDDDGTLSYAKCDAISAGVDNNEYDDQDGVNEDDRTECFDSIGKDLANRITRHNKASDPDVALQVGANDPHGNAIYIVNAQTGALIWKAARGTTGGFDGVDTLRVTSLDDGFPGDLIAADTSGNGLLDRVYAADTGGRVWRIDLAAFVDDDNDSATPDVLVIDDKSEWTMMELFNAGRHFFSDVANDRRFFNHVDLSQTRDDFGPFDAVLIGTGDREDPLGTATENWFYLVKDRAIVSGAPPATTLVHSDLADLSDNCLQGGTLAACGIDENQFANGWRIELEASPGEKNLAASVTSGGNLFFTTFAPDANASACGLSEGVGRFYAISLQDATAIINFDTTNDSGGTTYERYDTLGSGGIPVEVVPLGGGMILVQGQEVGENIVTTGGKSGFRTYWHEMSAF